MQRDRALILTALLAGLRADELLRANIGDLRRTDDGAVIHVRGKGGKDRRVPIESALVELLERYLDGRATRFPATVKRRSSPGGGLAAWPSAAPLFVGADGDRITRGTLQYPVVRAFRRAGIDADRARHGTAGTHRWIRRPRSRRRRPCRSACSPSSRIAARDSSGALRDDARDLADARDRLSALPSSTG